MTEPRNPPKRRDSLRIVVTVVAVVTILAAVVVGLSLLSTPQRGSDEADVTPEKPAKTNASSGTAVASKDAIEFVGAKTCAECHPGESAAHSRSGHARTLRPAGLTAVARWLDGQTVKDPENAESTWTYSLANGRLEVERAEGGKAECFPLDYALGSGTNGVTFVSVRPPRKGASLATGVEHRLSYFANGPKLGISPGQGNNDSAKQVNKVGSHGRDLDGTQLAHCLGCHATVTSAEGPGHVEPLTMVPNVSCELCHGPGSAHVEAARRGASADDLTMQLGVESATPNIQIGQCGQCHRQLSTVSPTQVSEENNELARFQPVGLALSRCFKDGKSGLSCTSCHDPHAKVSRDHLAYESICLKCHGPNDRTSCTVSPRTGCIDCHMPRRTVSVEFRFTDHWIRVPARGAKPPQK